MSILKMHGNGGSIGGPSEIFAGRQIAMALPEGDQKPIFLKITPGTDLYDQIEVVASKCQVKKPRAARLMIKAGWLGFARVFGGAK